MKKRIEYLWKFAKPYKWSFVNAFLCILFTSIISMIYPLVFGLLVDEVFYNKNIKFFVIIVIGYSIIYFTELLLHLILNIIWPYQFHVYLLEIRKNVYKKIVSLKYEKLSNIPIGEMVGKVNWQTDSFVELLHRNIAYLFAGTIKLIMLMFIVFFMDYRLGLLLLISVPISYITSYKLGKKVGEKEKDVKNTYKEFLSWLFEMLAGIRDIRLMKAEKNILAKFVELIGDYNEKKQKMAVAEIMSDRICALVAIVTKIFLYILSGILVYDEIITLGTFIAVISYYEIANTLLGSINKYWSKIHSNNVIIDDLIDLLESPIDEVDRERELNVTCGKIEIKNLHFAYFNEEVLKNITITINPGECVAIVGKSGAGKSTIANILLGLLEVKNGDVLIDSISLKDVSVKSIREQIGVVQQEIFIFDGTIRDNLKIANEKATDEEILEAIKNAGLQDYFWKLNDGLDTVIGQEGINISGGEKQRLAIARLFLKRSKILILDEATSALDSETETYVTDKWKNFTRSKTSIIIAHRLSTILNADKVIVLEDGRIVDYNRHDILLKKNEEYRDLFYKQYLNKEKVLSSNEKNKYK